MMVRMRDDLVDFYHETIAAITSQLGREPVMETAPVQTRTYRGKAVRVAAVWFVMTDQGPQNHGFRITTHSASLIEIHAWGTNQHITAKLSGFPSKANVRDIFWALLPENMQPGVFGVMESDEQ